jgi:hypothetical protein
MVGRGSRNRTVAAAAQIISRAAAPVHTVPERNMFKRYNAISSRSALPEVFPDPHVTECKEFCINTF